VTPESLTQTQVTIVPDWFGPCLEYFVGVQRSVSGLSTQLDRMEAVNFAIIVLLICLLILQSIELFTHRGKSK